MNVRATFLSRAGSKPKVGEVRMSRHLGAPVCFFAFVLLPTLILATSAAAPVAAAAPGQSAGSLEIVGAQGKVTGFCPLKHTDVRGAVSGFLAHVTVTQLFANPASEKIESVYTFPLPENAAVDDMTIRIGH